MSNLGQATWSRHCKSPESQDRAQKFDRRGRNERSGERATERLSKRSLSTPE
jgi:hypothetical protein